MSEKKVESKEKYSWRDLVLIAIFLVFCFFSSDKNVLSSQSHNVHGFAWSDRVGWISFNYENCDKDSNGYVDSGDCGSDNSSQAVVNYGVDVNATTGAFSGYAWSPSVGWISFDPNFSNGCPDSSVSPTACTPKINLQSGDISGFLRALSATVNRVGNIINLPGSSGAGSGNDRVGPPAPIIQPITSQDPPLPPDVTISSPSTISTTITDEFGFTLTGSFVRRPYVGSYDYSSNGVNMEWRLGIGTPTDCTDGILLQKRFDGNVIFGNNPFGSGTDNHMLTGGNTIYLRARVKSSNGLWSPWSDCHFRQVNYIPQSISVDEPVRRMDPAIFEIGGKIYAGLGTTNDLSKGFLNDMWEYSPSSQTWKKMANFPGTLRYGGVYFTLGNKGYFGLGYYNPTLSYDTGILPRDVWEFDPNNGPLGTWSRKNDFPGVGRMHPTAFVIAGKAYVGNGDISQWSALTTGQRALNDFWQYDSASDSWSPIPGFPGTRRYGASALVVGNMAYVTLGENENLVPLNPNDVNQFSTILNSGNIQAIIDFVSTHSVTSQVTYPNDTWQFDKSKLPGNPWTKTEDFPGIGRRLALSFVKGPSGYVGLGGSSAQSSFPYSSQYGTFWEFNPNRIISGKWHEVTGKTYPIRLETSVVTIGNKQFTLFGYGDADDSHQVYDDTLVDITLP